MTKRDTYKYVLKNGNKIQYVGITNDPQRREIEHRQNKVFQKMEIVGRATTRQNAEKWETQRIETYKKYHGGEIPLLNRTQNGK